MIRTTIADYLPQLVSIRHDLHQHPELSLQEQRTSGLIAKYLTAWGYQVHLGLAGTGVVAQLRSGSSTRSIGLRAAIDALPIQEDSTKVWASEQRQCMHASGNDGHISMLLGAARYLAATRHFDGTLNLIFQPAEALLSGSLLMVNQGLFKRFPCDQIFSLASVPGLPLGNFYFQPGVCIAAVDQFRITLKGRGGHSAQPHLAQDPVLVAASITQALQTIVARNVDPQQAAIITVSSIQAGNSTLVIPSYALMRVNMHAFSTSVRQHILQRIPALVMAQALSFGIQAEVDLVNSAPAVVNHSATTAQGMAVAVQLFGQRRVQEHFPALLTSEDFGFMLQAQPQGCYLWMGSGDSPDQAGLYSPDYDFNDACLLDGSHYWAQLVEHCLSYES